MATRLCPLISIEPLHVFKTNEIGGIETVIAKDPTDSQQITLIQQHLQHEAM